MTTPTILITILPSSGTDDNDKLCMSLSDEPRPRLPSDPPDGDLNDDAKLRDMSITLLAPDINLCPSNNNTSSVHKLGVD